MKKRLLSAITATGKLTIGNYIGAIKNFIKLQKEYDVFIFVADLHALTIDIEPEELRENKKNILAIYIACGLDPQKCTLFYQSDVIAHSQMSWIMENRTTIGELSRMTQFKSKSKIKEKNKTEKIKTGLLTYPALMAADILLYNPEIVPVGQDQKQHLELTRNIAKRFNNKFNYNFIIPEPYISKVGSKIMSLTNPEEKMSKSSKKINSYISLLDDPEKAYKKIQKAVTDSENKVYISKEKPGITNLINIYASLNDLSLEKTEEKFKNSNYKEFKHEVGLVVKKFLIKLQDKYSKAISKIDEVAKIGKEKATKVANNTLEEVEKKIGIK